MTDGSTLPNWLSFDAATKTIAGIAPQGEDISLTIVATDPDGLQAEQSFNLISNTPPETNKNIEAFAYRADEANQLHYILQDGVFYDLDGDVLSYQATMIGGGKLPDAISMNASTGALTINALQPLESLYHLDVIATDSHGASVTGSIQLDIGDAVNEAAGGLTTGSLGDDVIVGTANTTHTLNGLLGDDIMQGANYNDRLSGGSGDDILIGHQGADYLNGGYGNDTFIFTKGDGADTIKDHSGNDTLDLSAFNLSNLVVDLDGRDLVIKFDAEQTNNTDSVTIENWNPWFGGQSYHVETIQLADTVLTDDQLMAIIG